jgi:peptidoglycan-associated lipoprotein
MKKLFWSGLLVSLVLAGCASGVKLDDVPVEDKSATSSGVSVQGVGAGQGGAQTGVVSLTADMWFISITTVS